MTEARLNRLEDEFETVKQLLASAARYAELANEGLERLSVKVDNLATAQDRTQAQLDQLSLAQTQLSSRVNEFVYHTQRLFNQHAERLERVEGQTERLEAIVRLLDRNYQAQQSQLQEFGRTTNAALERIDRVLDYLLRQQGGS